MNSNLKKLIITIIVFAAVIIAGIIAYKKLGSSLSGSNISMQTADNRPAQDTANHSDTSESDTDTPHNLVPDITFTDIDGNVVSISNFYDKPIILNFWATTCPYCLNEIPEFNDVYQEYKDTIHFIMMDVAGFNGETADKAKQYVSENDYSLPFYFDTEESVMDIFGINSLPMTLFIQKGGEMTAYANGQCDAETLKKGISMIIEN